MSTLRLRWRFFWSRRSRGRINAAILFAMAAVLGVIYFALPSDAQHQVTRALALVGQGIGSLDATALLVGVVAVCAVVSLVLIFVRPYSRHSYLASAPSMIPTVSVYVDAENQLSAATIRPFAQFLIKHLDGRRADLLYFLDASKTSTNEKYKMLFRFGFRPVDVPHDPTGMGDVKEAVDREIDMHAYERALLGPPEQEFIIVTGDGDFVPLIYRLAALGHRVQIWATSVRDAYRIVETYLGITVIDLSQVIAEQNAERDERQSADTSLAKWPRARRRRAYTSRRRPQSKRSGPFEPPHVVAPPALTLPGEQQVYFAVLETRAALAEAQRRSREDASRRTAFESFLRGALGPRLAGIGYSAGSWADYWLDHLAALGLLLKGGERSFPRPGSANAEDAARDLFAMSRAMAEVAAPIGLGNADSLVRMSEIAAALTANVAAASAISPALLALVAPGNGKRITHTRYFVRSARALGLLEFEDVPDSLDVIAHPRLPALSGPDKAADEGTDTDTL